MGISDQLQMLISAFIFGSLFQTALAAMLLFLRGYGLKVIKDRRRLVLVIFLATAATWAQVDFINYAVPSSSGGVCHGTIIVSTLLDQAGRTLFGGFLLWSVGHVKKPKSETYGLIALMGTRAILGFIFVGYTSPQFAPVCVAQSSMPAVSAIVIALDIIVTGILTIRIFTLGLIDTIRDVRSTTKQEQSKAFVYCTAGFFLWTVTSSAMLLGSESIPLLLRTALPAIGWMVLITVMTLQYGALVLPRESDGVVPEARSPFVSIQSRSMESTNDRNGSPISSTGYKKTGRLFVVNPCSILSSARSTIFQSNGSRGSAKLASTSNSFTEDRSRGSSRVYDGLPMASGAIISDTPAKGAVDQSRDLGSKRMTIAERRQKRSLLRRVKGVGEECDPKLAISGPIIQVMETSHSRPLSRIKTIELTTAASSERARREEAASRRLVATRAAPPPPTMSASEALRKLSVTKRKDISGLVNLPKQLTTEGTILPKESRLSLDVNATSTSASLSPGSQDVRRRSPRTMITLEREEGPNIKKLPEIPKAYSSRPESNQQAGFYADGIEYNQPSLVRSVIKSAASNPVKQKSDREPYLVNSPGSPNSTPSDSVMHRPRPQKRSSEHYRTFLGSQPSPDRKPSSKTSFSKISGKSPPATNPEKVKESLTQPPPSQRPTSAAALRKLLPNNPQSMTTCEKISLLFPAPPGALNNRRSSVPSLPRVLSTISSLDSLASTLTEEEQKEIGLKMRRRTVSLGACPDHGLTIPIAQTLVLKDSLASEAPQIRFPEGFTHSETQTAARLGPSITNYQERSAFSVSDFDGDEYQDAMKSAYASLHSPVPAVDITTAMQTAKETFIQMRKGSMGDGKFSQPISAVLPSKGSPKTANDEGIMTVMLGVDAVELTEASARRTFSMDANPSVSSQKQLDSQASRTWHRRIGDELPAFSGRRKYSTQSTPPPPPLQLSSNARLATIVSREPAVEEVIDTPGKAVRALQAQLSRLDGPDKGSLGFLSHSVLRDSSRSFNPNSNDPFGLLANLEEEMAKQETQWMQMQQNFIRDSNSFVMTPRHGELRSLPSPPSEVSSQRSSPSSHQKLRARNSRSNHSDTTPSTQTSENSEASVWQRRLAEAQLDFTENKSALVGRQFVNFFSMTKMNLGSPTPPDSLDSASDSGSDFDCVNETVDDKALKSTGSSVMVPKTDLLWKPRPCPPAIAVGFLWSQASRHFRTLAVCSESVVLARTRLHRPYHPPLFITSSVLWTKPVLNNHKSTIGWLWVSKKLGPKSSATRPKTQRPERKSRRMTLLPDIVEHPSPLPHKRDTLGIYQFPWGEKSDSAVYNQIPLPPRSGVNLQYFAYSQYLEMKPLPVPPELEELEEYSSNFFGEYGEFHGDGSDGTSDDDFDEATLWEIAGLLHSQDVPSINSLLPPPRIIEDYDDNELGDDFTESVQVYDQVDHTPVQSPLTIIKPLSPKTSPLPQLWVKPTEQTPSRVEIGIDQPENQTWQAYLSPNIEPARARSRNGVSQVTASNITSRSLWENDRAALPSQSSRENIKLWSQRVVREDNLTLPHVENRPWSALVSATNISASLKPDETPFKPRSPCNASITGTKVLASRELWESKVEASAFHDAAKSIRNSCKLVVPNAFRQNAVVEDVE